MSLKYPITYTVFSLIYLIALNWEPFVASWVIKIAPFFVILYLLLTLLQGKIRVLAVAALLFSMSGDILLNMNLFVPGLASFLVAQLIYTSIFIQGFNSFERRRPLLFLLLGHMALMVYLLTPELGELFIPVMAYLVVIGAMGMTSVVSKYPTKWLVVGAFLFILSDSLIAINKFLMPLPLADYLIMSTYYGAQLGILYSLIRFHKVENAAV